MTDNELEIALAERELRRRRAAAVPVSTGPGGDIPMGGPAAPAPDNRTARDSLNPVGKVMLGLSEAIGQPIYALKSALGGLNQNDQRIIAENKAKTAEAGPVAQAAKIAGDIALLAAPSTAVAKGAEGLVKAQQALQKFPKLAAALGLSAGGAAAGAVGGAAEAPEGEGFIAQQVDRGGRILKGALAGAVGAPVIGALGKAVSEGIVKPSAEALHQMRNGITPKLQEGAESGFWRGVGSLTSGAIDPKNTRQAGEVLDELQRRIAPGLEIRGATIPERLGMMRQVLNKGYDDVLSNKTYTIGKTEVNSILRAGRKDLNQGARRIFEKHIDEILPKQTMNIKYWANDSNRGLSKYQKDFQTKIDDLMNEGTADSMAAARAMQRAKDAFEQNVRNSKLTPQEIVKVDDLDRAYGSFRPIVEAAGKDARKTERLASSDITNASKRGDNLAFDEYANADILAPTARAEARAREIDSRAAMVGGARALGLAKLGAGTSAAVAIPGAPLVAAPAYAVSLLGQTGAGARALFGTSDKQKRLAEFLRNYRPELVGGAGLTSEQIVGD